MNTFGHLLRLTSFGESHGPAIGGVLDGMPAGLRIDLDAVQAELDRRRPGSGAAGTSARRESDTLTVLSGLLDGLTTGAPIAFTIANTDARSSDYDAMRHVMRPGHADAAYMLKYGGIRDHRGGGRASARLTAVVVAAGAIARQFIATAGIAVSARATEIGGATSPAAMELLMKQARACGDTLGGIVECTATGVPAGLGEPLFGKLQAMLAAAMMSINAAKGFDYGDGFAAARMRGSESIDTPQALDSALRSTTNHAGGILGGISIGADITMRVAFKPIATMMRTLPAIADDGTTCTLIPHGRHDVCAVPRAVPVVEAMACLTLGDALLLARASTL
ncbi:MAG: chorismate synthase [Muribaculaceae bacterium]|nr:chorismate synthase [Muribaculaceae bacterium]